MRKKTFQLWREAAKLGAYDEMPMLPEDKQVQVHLSKNDRAQPFYLICGKDTLLSLMSGAAQVEFRGTAIDRFTLKPASFVYVPAGAPHRIVPTVTSIMMRTSRCTLGSRASRGIATNATPKSIERYGIPRRRCRN